MECWERVLGVLRVWVRKHPTVHKMWMMWSWLHFVSEDWKLIHNFSPHWQLWCLLILLDFLTGKETGNGTVHQHCCRTALLRQRLPCNKFYIKVYGQGSLNKFPCFEVYRANRGKLCEEFWGICVCNQMF